MSGKGRLNTWRTLTLILALTLIFSFSLAAAEDKESGTLNVALASEPGTLDMALSTGVAASIPARHVFEGLLAFDKDYKPQPMLLSSWELSEDGKTATFHLREGVKFHSGEEMVAEDVVASLNRWGEYGLTNSALWTRVEEVTEIDDYTVEMTLSEPFAPLTTYLANIYGGPRIVPAEIAREAGGEPIDPENYVGTGPYKFVEWKAGDYISLERFNNYSNPPTAPSGFAGRKLAYFESIKFSMVSEAGARVSGVKAGNYDYATKIPTDMIATIEGSASTDPVITDHPPIYPIMLINTQTGVLADATMRQAVQAALDMDSIMAAGYGNPTFWTLDGAYFAEGIRWRTLAGAEAYDQADVAKAKELADEAGYDGEPIDIIVAIDMTAQYNQSLVVRNQLRQAGFNAQLETFDKATFFQRRNDRENAEWELAFSFYSTTPDPSLVLMLNEDYPGWWDTPEIDNLKKELNTTTNFEERYGVWEEIRTLWYEQVPAIKFGDAYQLHVRGETLKGYGTEEQPVMVSPYFWNTWKE
ncbi:ABC transporter substrate-binding protein [Candidatus Bipolaricaulota bacterium]|nr:ABC transporter substrate-binding protein [Candidatus Bipolaricaulota bacterium]